MFWWESRDIGVKLSYLCSSGLPIFCAILINWSCIFNYSDKWCNRRSTIKCPCTSTTAFFQLGNTFFFLTHRAKNDKWLMHSSWSERRPPLCRHKGLGYPSVEATGISGPSIFFACPWLWKEKAHILKKSDITSVCICSKLWFQSFEQEFLLKL